MDSDVTALLHLARDGDASALGRLLPAVYDDLRRLARRQRGQHWASETLNTTALVHEAYERLASNASLSLADRDHFFRVAGRVMRAVLVDYARAQTAQKRGGRDRPLPLDGERAVADVRPDAAGVRVDEVLAVDGALGRLEALDERMARVVECRYFAGLSVEETAGALGISEATVKRDWTTARAWLRRALTT